MSNAWTVFFTVVAGVAVYVLGQLLVAIWVEPIRNLRKLIAEIGRSLIFYANVYTNVVNGERGKLVEAGETFRRQASELRVASHSIWGYWIASTLKMTPVKRHVDQAPSELIGLSNGTLVPSPELNLDNSKKADKIRDLLYISR